MDYAQINFLAVPTTAILALIGAPLAFRRAGYEWGKVVFGALAVLIAALGLTGIVVVVQYKLGLSVLPLAWIMPPLLAFALYRIALFGGMQGEAPGDAQRDG